MDNNLKFLILDQLAKNKQIKTAIIVKQTGFSRTYINRAFQELRDEGKILLLGKNKGAIYVLANKISLESAKKKILAFHEEFKNENLSEEMVLKRTQEQTGVFLGLKDNVDNIFTYAFLEMVNNAIEHSQSPAIHVSVERTDNDLIFVVSDDGVGIFDNIKNKFNLPNNLMAIQQLLKGKQTTSPENHTGQGIFFTSKMADAFVVESSGKKVRFLNSGGINDVFLEDFKDTKGTKVRFTLSLDSAKTSQEIFAEYTDKDTFEFSKTKVSVKLYEVGADLLSRSEARRIMMWLEKFQDIELDFKDVKTVGQSFADEIFRVWKNSNPDKNIEYKNTNENVEFMIKRAIA